MKSKNTLSRRFSSLQVHGLGIVVICLGTFFANASPYRVPAGSGPNAFDEPPGEMPVLNIPEGCTNLALGKSVTSSDPSPILGKLEQITDGERGGEKGHLFSYDEYLVEFEYGTQYVQVDLQEDAVIHAIWIWHPHPVEAYDVPKGVVVQIASDSEFTEGVYTVFNNNGSIHMGFGRGNDRRFATSRFGKLIYTKGIVGRFVRIWGDGSFKSNSNRFNEVEVYGIPATTRANAVTGPYRLVTEPARNRTIWVFVTGLLFGGVAGGIFVWKLLPRLWRGSGITSRNSQCSHTEPAQQDGTGSTLDSPSHSSTATTKSSATP